MRAPYARAARSCALCWLDWLSIRVRQPRFREHGAEPAPFHASTRCRRNHFVVVCEQPFKEPRSLVWTLDPGEDRFSVWYVCLHHLRSLQSRMFSRQETVAAHGANEKIFFRALAIPRLAASPAAMRFRLRYDHPRHFGLRCGVRYGFGSKKHSYGPMHRWCGPLRGAQRASPEDPGKPACRNEVADPRVKMGIAAPRP